MKSKYLGFAAALGMLLLILDGRTAIMGAQEGVELCLRSVIPSLFPFFVLSIMLTGSLSGIHLGFLRPLGRFCGIPEGAEALLLTGFLGGYPVGAQCVASAYRSGQISETQSERMLAFCNNAGPSFLFGIVASQFSNIRYAWLLWAIQIISAVLVARTIPSSETTPIIHGPTPTVTLSDTMKQAILAMATVCGWVTLFRVAIAFCGRWFLWLLPKSAQIVFCGILELTNGCCSLSEIENIGLRFLICAVVLSFGGICVTMQTLSVTKGLNSKNYFLGKLLQSGYTFMLAVLCQCILPPSERWTLFVPLILPGAALLTVLGFALRKKQNNSSNPSAIGV